MRRPPRRSAPVSEIADHPPEVLEQMPHDLAQEESSALRRISPRRSKWREIDDLDKRVAELEQRGQAAGTELQRLHEERRLAPQWDARALADWIAAGEKDRRPEPTATVLDGQIEGAERERDALAKAAADVLAEKVTYVEKHRKRLVKEADSAVDQAAQRYDRLIAELAATRSELAEARHAAVWAGVYPARSAGTAPPDTMVGGKRKLLERASITAQVQPERIWELLREDSAYVATALTEEQAAELGMKREDEATWASTDAGREAERREKAEALERHRRLWGTTPA